jgi:hypothetical protein
VLLLSLQLSLTQPLSAVAAELKVTLEQVATSSGHLLVLGSARGHGFQQ